MKLLTELDSLDNVKDGETRKLITKTTSSGSGNVVSSVSVSGDTITYTKGVSALIAHQNTFSKVKVGSAEVAADSAGDTLELVAGNNVTLTPDTTSDKITIAASQPTKVSQLTNDSGYITSDDLPTNHVSYEQNSVSVAGTTKTVSKVTPETLYVPNGLIMGGTAQAAGLVTRGICGVGTPTSTGACNKENLYINYDGNDNFNTGRQIVLNAGSVGTHLGNNLYAYTVPRGDIVKAWVEAKGYTTNTGTITGVSVNGTSIATSGVANITNMPASILSGAIPSAVTATTQSASDNSTKLATTAFVKTAIDNLPEPMVFKGSLGAGGTITALSVDGSATIGDTYKVITAGTYASKAAKVGDTFICLTKTSSANTWELIPSGDEPSGTVTSITIKGSSPITVDSESAITTSGTRTISHANSGVTAGTYRSVTVNATGHVTAGTNPTTLSGYGITDAKIASGVITLGSNTITPLTASSTLDATKVSGTLPTSTYTDTKNTAGSTDTSSKIFLIGATSQAANPQTYSDNEVYVTSGVLTTKSVQVGGASVTIEYNSTDKCIEFNFV